MEVEREFRGWKLVLNTTEFVVCPDLPLYVRWMEKYRPDVVGIWGYDFVIADPLAERDTKVTEAPLVFQKRWGYHPGGQRSHLLHRAPDGQYDTGRHSSPLVGKVLDDGFFIAWFGWSPMRSVAGRKLQIQRRIPERDRAARLGCHHMMTVAELEGRYRAEAAAACDLWERHPAYFETIAYLAERGDTLRLPSALLPIAPGEAVQPFEIRFPVGHSHLLLAADARLQDVRVGFVRFVQQEHADRARSPIPRIGRCAPGLATPTRSRWRAERTRLWSRSSGRKFGEGPHTVPNRKP